MSFRCGICGEAQPAGTKAVRVTTEVRFIILDPLLKKDLETKLVNVQSRHRTEIVKEVLACSGCAAKPVTPEVVDTINESNTPNLRRLSREKISRLIYYILSFLFLNLLLKPSQLPQPIF
jgi:hypothetical protein